MTYNKIVQSGIGRQHWKEIKKEGMLKGRRDWRLFIPQLTQNVNDAQKGWIHDTKSTSFITVKLAKTAQLLTV
jgi:hypothetical protein